MQNELMTIRINDMSRVKDNVKQKLKW